MGTHLELLPVDHRSPTCRSQETVDHVGRGQALVGLEERVFPDDATIVLDDVVCVEVRQAHSVLPVVFLEEICNGHNDLTKPSGKNN